MLVLSRLPGYSRGVDTYFILRNMLWWSHLSALGGLNVTALLAIGVTAWLGGARCWRLALVWCGVFGGALFVAAASQMAFIGWGIGIRSLSFTGFSGHATRAAAVRSW